MKSKRLILLTANFPFDNGEPFLETEIEYLAATFDEVVILTRNTSSNRMRSIPENCSVVRESFAVGASMKLFALTGLLKGRVRKEIRIAKKSYGLDRKQILKTLLVSEFRGRQMMKKVVSIVDRSPEEPTVCYSYWADDAAIGLAMLKEARPEVACVTRVHGWDLYFEASEMNYLPYRQFLGKRLDRIFSISEKGQQYCSERWGIDREKVTIARLGVRKQSDQPMMDTELRVVSCSNMIPLKRVHLIIEALSKLNKKEVHWYHFGSGQLKESLEKQAAELLTPEQYSFMGQISNPDLMRWYREHPVAVFINVSSTEGIPVSIMEAMSFGIPAIATNVGGTGEIVNDRNGVLLASDPTVNSIASALEHILTAQPDVREKFGKEAFEMWKQHYFAEDNYEDFSQQLEGLLTV